MPCGNSCDVFETVMLPPGPITCEGLVAVILVAPPDDA